VRPLSPVLRFGPALAVMGIIFVASSTPGSDLPSFTFFDLLPSFDVLSRKGGHVVGYALLGLAYLLALVPRGEARLRAAAFAVGLAACYGVTDEIHQVFTPGRGPGASDVVIDTVGASLGVGLRLLRQARRGSGEVPLAE
jgi:VanZ family protein